MKIIEAMKEIKRLREKVDDLKTKISLHSADYDYESAPYPNQSDQLREWVQSAEDTLKRVLELRIAIQRTNLITNVTIELGGTQVTKSIAEWVHRRGDKKNPGLASIQMSVWGCLTSRGLKDGTMKTSTGDMKDVKVRLYYNSRERDERLAVYREEASRIDSTLEVVNAVTDVVGLVV